MSLRGSLTVYLLLAGLWLIIGLWQVIEHVRVRDYARASLYRRAEDISTTVGVVVRSQRFFTPQTRIDSTLQHLAGAQDLRSVALLNSQGEVLASAGEPIQDIHTDFSETAYQWDERRLTVVNPVDFGSEMEDRDEKGPAAVIVPDPDLMRPPDGIRSATGPDEFFPPPPPPMPPPEWDWNAERRSAWRMSFLLSSPDFFLVIPSPKLERIRQSASGRNARKQDDAGLFRGYPAPSSGNAERVGPTQTRRDGPRWRPDRPWRSRRFSRPPFMSNEKYEELLKKKGLYGFMLVMSTDAFTSETQRDLWLRIVMMTISSVAAVGLGLAWRSIQRNAQLQMRLIRASEMNQHLREMNTAAAGLAHETRNPLNIVRGLAQMISSRSDASGEIRKQASGITEEVDRVSARLNDFIEYSRPPQIRPSPRNLLSVAQDLERTLESDFAEKNCSFSVSGPNLVIEADEPSLRQILFNLILNAVQAIPSGGWIEVAIEERDPHEALLEVRDNGPGVPLEAREAIFRPYFTMHEGGAGLGLAIVRQLVLANGWEIEYISGKDGGAVFRIQGLKIISRNP